MGLMPRKSGKLIKLFLENKYYPTELIPGLLKSVLPMIKWLNYRLQTWKLSRLIEKTNLLKILTG